MRKWKNERDEEEKKRERLKSNKTKEKQSRQKLINLLVLEKAGDVKRKRSVYTAILYIKLCYF